MTDLSKLIVQSKTIEVEYPDFKGFIVNIAYLTRDEIVKLRKKATNSKFNRKTRQPEEDVDLDLFQNLYIKAVLKGWKGLKYEYLKEFFPIDLSQAEGEELEFSQENAVVLMKNSTDFDSWISEIVDDVQNFTKGE